MKKIILQPVGEIKEEILSSLKKGLEDIFSFLNIVIEISNSPLPLKKSSYNQTRGQYNGSKVIRTLYNQQYDRHTFRVLGIMDKDLYSGNLNFIFGLATTSKSATDTGWVAALISITRLRQTFYAKPKDRKLFRERVLKEGVHELGHTFGLSHCNNYCIMRFSNHLGQTDEKPLEFCDSCTAELKKYVS